MPITLMKSWLSARVTGKDIGTVGACSTIVLVTTALNTLLLMGAVVRDISIFELECWLGWCSLLWGALIGRRMIKRRWGLRRDVMARYRAQVVTGTLLASPWAWMAGSHIGELGTSA